MTQHRAYDAGGGGVAITGSSRAGNGMTPIPLSEAGKRLLDNLAAEYDDRHMEPYRASIAAIEAEAREKMLVAWEAAVENAIRIEIAAERERLAEAVRGLESSEWRDCPGNCHDHTIAAILAIVRGEQP